MMQIPLDAGHLNWGDKWLQLVVHKQTLQPQMKASQKEKYQATEYQANECQERDLECQEIAPVQEIQQQTWVINQILGIETSRRTIFSFRIYKEGQC